MYSSAKEKKNTRKCSSNDFIRLLNLNVTSVKDIYKHSVLASPDAERPKLRG